MSEVNGRALKLHRLGVREALFYILLAIIIPISNNKFNQINLSSTTLGISQGPKIYLRQSRILQVTFLAQGKMDTICTHGIKLLVLGNSKSRHVQRSNYSRNVLGPVYLQNTLLKPRFKNTLFI